MWGKEQRLFEGREQHRQSHCHLKFGVPSLADIKYDFKLLADIKYDLKLYVDNIFILIVHMSLFITKLNSTIWILTEFLLKKSRK